MIVTEIIIKRNDILQARALELQSVCDCQDPVNNKMVRTALSIIMEEVNVLKNITNAYYAEQEQKQKETAND